MGCLSKSYLNMKEVKLINGNYAVDDRGYVSFVNDFKFDDVKRFYIVENHQPQFVRAWHGHLHEKKYVQVLNGSAKFGVVDLDTKEIIYQGVLSHRKPQILSIPEGCANGFMTLEPNTKIIFYSNKELSESLNDDIRYHFAEWNIWNIEPR